MTIKYIGIIEGTNKGHCVLSVDRVDGKIQGNLFIHDIHNQNLNAKIDFVEKGNTFQAKAYDFNPDTEGNPKTAELTGQIMEDGKEMFGEWKTDIKTEGTFRLFKHEEDLPVQASLPKAFLSKTVNLPACKLGINELAGLLMLIKQDVNQEVQPS